MSTDPESSEEEELYEHYNIRTDPGQQPIRVDKFLVDRLANTSRNKIQVAARSGNIRVNGRSVKPNYKIKAEEEVSIVMPYPKREIELIPQDIPLEIHHEDEDVIVINKPAGMVVHPGYGNYSGTLVNALVHHFGQLPSQDEEAQRPGLVHRLDKNTTGLMVVAKNEFALSHLAGQFFERTTDREYLALVWGSVKEDNGTVTGHIGRSKKNRKVFVVYEDGEFGKHAVTHYEVVERFDYVTLVKCKLETGRTHQIRVHMKHLGHPLFNDPEYGGNEVLRGTTFSKYKQFVRNCFALLPGQALHARSLGFTHPVSGERISLETDLPEGFGQVMEKWRIYTASR